MDDIGKKNDDTFKRDLSKQQAPNFNRIKTARTTRRVGSQYSPMPAKRHVDVKKPNRGGGEQEENGTLTRAVVRLASKLGDGWRAIVLLGLMIVSPIIDVASGSVAMMLMLDYDPALIGGVSEGLLAWSLSIFTSGIQILFTMIFTNGGKKRFKPWQLGVIIFIMLADTLLDMTVPFYIFYNEAPLQVSVLGKPLLFYVVMILFGVACLMSEQILFMIARLGRKKR